MKNYSRQREAIVRALANTVCHPTAEELCAEVKKNVPTVSLATVYRNLKVLSDEGEILTIRSDDEKLHYDGTVFPHAHFCCTECGKVRDIMLDQNQIAALRHIRPDASFELNFHGVCDECQSKQ